MAGCSSEGGTSGAAGDGASREAGADANASGNGADAAVVGQLDATTGGGAGARDAADVGSERTEGSVAPMDGPVQPADGSLGSGEAAPDTLDAESDGPFAREDATDSNDAPGDGPDGDASDCPLGPSGEALELRCAGLYSDWPSRTVAPDARAYDPGLRLWSDGANKSRWVQLPKGATIDTSNMDDWVFPVGTKFWKEFTIGGKRIETRLLWKPSDGLWYATTYRWTADQSSAVELTGGELNADGHGYEVPAQFACRSCHQGRPDFVLGFEAVSLSSPAASGQTIASLASAGLLSAPPAARIVIPGTATEAAALGYLHANCGTTCHNPESPAYNKGFYMRLAVSQLGRVEATDTWMTGWNVPTVDFPGKAGTPIRIAACDAGGSSVYYRMSRRDGVGDAGESTQMPPNDTHKVDDAGITLIAAWIDEGCADAGAHDAH